MRIPCCKVRRFSTTAGKTCSGIRKGGVRAADEAIGGVIAESLFPVSCQRRRHFFPTRLPNLQGLPSKGVTQTMHHDKPIRSW
jgi:hypothetical protein